MSKYFAKVIALEFVVVALLLQSSAYAQGSSVVRERRVATGAAEATITVNEQFLNSFLTAVFDNLREPSTPLGADGGSSGGQYGCASEIRLKREVNGVRTAVHFESGRIVGPLAFAGAYNSTLIGCIDFSGWADSEIKLEFDTARQALLARFQLREIHVNNVPTIANGPLLNVVQSAIDRRYNPLELITLEKLSSRVDVKPAGGALQLRPTEVRPEINPGTLTLHITYEFVRA